MKLELLAKCLNELVKDRPEFADKDICIEQTSNNESKIYVAQYDETSKSWTKLYWIKNLDTIKESIKQNMKKTYKVKNYKGNLVESLKKFSEKYKGMKIIEACEDGKMLKIKADLKENETDLTEAANFKTRMFFADDVISKEEIENDRKKYKVWYEKDTEHPETTQDGWPYIVTAQDKEHFIKWFKERYMGSEYSEEEIQDALSDYI